MHTCDNLIMAMREILCSDEGDQGLNEGDFSKLQKGVLKRLIEVFNPLHSSGLPFTQSYNKYRIDESKHYVTNQYHPEHYGLYPKAGKYCGWH